MKPNIAPDTLKGGQAFSLPVDALAGGNACELPTSTGNSFLPRNANRSGLWPRRAGASANAGIKPGASILPVVAQAIHSCRCGVGSIPTRVTKGCKPIRSRIGNQLAFFFFTLIEYGKKISLAIYLLVNGMGGIYQ